MSNEQLRSRFQVIQQQIVAALPREDMKDWQEIDAAFEELHGLYEETQTSLEVAEIVEEALLQQNQRVNTEYQRYYDLFQSSPLAYLVTDANGLILEANQAITQLLNMPQSYLLGKPLAVYVAEGDRRAFRTNLNLLFQSIGRQIWQVNLCRRAGEPFLAELTVATVRHHSGWIESLRIGVYDISQFQQRVAQLTQRQNLKEIRVEVGKELNPFSRIIPQLPQSLDGLHVLVVDDEADAREFITAVLQSQGIRVTAVANAAAALQALEQSPHDVLVSDIRMPGGDGYSLIRQIRALEAKQGGHIPAAALTAYLDEDREKALSAGFEAHLHKLAQPSELIKMVDQLARRASGV